MKFEIKSKTAMSLGEVLITLGIIGLVAAITVPILMVVIPNKNETLTKKGNYILEHTISDVVNNDDYYPVKKIITVNVAGEEETNSTYGLKNTDKASGTNCEGESKFCCLMAKSLTLYPGAPVDCSTAGIYNFKTADGIEWQMPISDFSSGTAQEIRFRTLERNGKDCFATSVANTCKDPNILTYKITSEGKLYSYKPTSVSVTPGLGGGGSLPVKPGDMVNPTIPKS